MTQNPVLPAPPDAAGAMQAARAALDALAEVEWWRLREGELLAARSQLEEAGTVLDAVRLAATAEIEARGAAVSTGGATSTRAWLAHTCRQHPGAAHQEVRLAVALRDRVAGTAAAMRAGACPRSAAAVIADAVDQVTQFAPQRAEEAEAFLLAQARALGAKPLAVAARRLVHTLDPDQGTRLDIEDQRVREQRHLILTERRDGSLRLKGLLDREAGVVLRTALEPLAKPRPATDGQPDPRPADARLADALVGVAEVALAHGDLPDTGSQRPHVTLTVSLATLAASSGQPGVAPGELDRGGPVTAETARRLTCDARITPLLLGGLGQPLALGRATRTPSPGLLRALAARDFGCAFPGCDRPVAWTVAHHVRHWADGGHTDVTNLVLLCGQHHRAVHHHGWSVAIEQDGLPSFRPPACIDPSRPALRQPRPHLLL